ncbi:uncharacterized protein LOC143212165 [Lasioglossum baleicum]|uniref:uncharacterized protein LOC143212165 n=1 Tax=Lasioglossum baleicum TaxID=434251 RepID=UPI003FCDC6CF
MYFMDMIPIQKIAAISLKYAAEDREFQELMSYMKTTEFKQMVQELEAIPEYHNFANYMQKNGVYLVDVTNKVNKLLGLPAFTPMDLYRTNGLKGFWEEVKDKVSYDQFIHGYVYKMRTSAAFRGFVAHLKSDNHQRFVNAMYSNQKYLTFRNMINSRGIDIALIEDIIYTVLGIEFPQLKKFEAATFSNPELGKDLLEFIDLLDMEKIMSIVISYMDDDQIQKAFEYIYSEEFHVLVRQVEAMKEYQELVLYLEDAGLDMFGFLQSVHKLLGMEDYVPPKPQLYSATTFVNKGGLKRLVDDVIATLPRDKLKALYYQKMANSPAFKNFMQKIRSDDFKHIVNLIYSSPVFREMRAKVIAAGLDLEPVKELIKKIIGYDLPDVPMNFEAATFSNPELGKDLQEFINLLDMEKIMSIVIAYMEDDEIQKAFEYIYSEEFHVLVRQVEAMKEYQELVLYLEDAGLDMFGFLQRVHKFFGMEDYVPPKPQLYSATTFVNKGGLKRLVDDVIATLPRDKLKALYYQKMANSPAFKNFMQKIRSDDFKHIVNLIYSSPVFREMRAKVIAAGLDLEPVKELIKKIIGYDLPDVPMNFEAATFSNPELGKDLQEFINLLDIEKIMNIVIAYMDDDEIQKAFEYIYSEEFHVLVRQVEAMKEYQQLVLYLEDAGLDMFGFLQRVHKFFGMEDYVPPKPQLYSATTFVNKGGLKRLVDDVIATLPRDKLKALYYQKMANSPAFKNFMQKIRSDDFKHIVNLIYSSPVFREMRAKVIAAGLDLEPVKELIKKIIGYDLPDVPMNFEAATFSNPELGKDLQEFINLLDIEKIMNIVIAYMDDDEIQKAFEYIYSEEFHVLVRQVEAMKEYQQLVLYLEDAGLDMFGFLQRVHKFFGMEDYVPPKPQLYSATTFVNKGGLKRLVDDVIATLPRDKLKALYYQKMANSPAFKNFMQKIRSDDFKHIVNLIYSSPVFREMRAKVIAAGLDLEPVKELIKKIIGYDLPDVPMNFEAATFSNPELGKDLQEFINLLDIEKIMNIVIAYMDDDEIQKAFEYIYSEEFHVLVRQVEAMKEYQQLVLYLEDAGLDMFGFLQRVHKLFGMEDYVPPKPQLYSATTFVNKGGLKRLVDDVIATLPRDKLKALYYQKMANSPAFKNFMQKIRSDDFKHIVNLIYSSPVFREMRAKVIAAGLDLEPVKELIKKIIGYDLPDVPMNFEAATFSNPELGKDLQEFINLLDIEKIMNIVIAYMDDDEIQKAFEYIYSEEFHVLVRQVEAMKEYQQLVLYLEDAGLDMFGFLQRVHKLFGMEDYVPPKPQLYSATTFVNKGGLKRLVDDVIATLPRDKLKALYYQKMANSPAFKNFMQKIRSDDFKHIVNLIYSSPVFREMRAKVIAAGLDLEPVKELIKKIIGYDLPDVPMNFEAATFSNPELGKDLQEFINLLDIEKIMNIVIAYMDDDEIQKAFEYIYSEEFHVLVRQVEAMKEYQQLVLYLEDAGLDMFGFLQRVHKLFGMEDYVPPKPQLYSATTFVNKGGLKRLVDDVIATLPRDKLKALYYQKMANSPAFKNFMQKIRSDDFKHIVNLIYSSPVFLEMRAKVIAAGLDLEPVKELIKKIIGYDLPDVPMY